MDNRHKDFTQSSKTNLIYGKPLTFRPVVSIAIPTYRRFSLLKKAVESALSQRGCSPYEVIVLDDDQSPGILDVVNSFEPFKIAVYQNSTNLGMWPNMNRALELAKGEWLLMLHDDDLLMPKALQAFERVISSSNGQEIGCLAGGVEVLYEGAIRPLWNTRQTCIRFPIAAIKRSTDKVICVTDHMHFIDTPKFCSSFFRRQYVKKIGGWNAKYCGYADLALFLKIAKDKRLFITKEIFGHFRSHDNNVSHPNRLWETFPFKAAQQLLIDYADETTDMGRNVYTSIECMYTTALWKRRHTKEERRKYASEFLKLINVKTSKQRFLLHNGWLIDILSKLYRAIRPILGLVSRLIFRNKS